MTYLQERQAAGEIVTGLLYRRARAARPARPSEHGRDAAEPARRRRAVPGRRGAREIQRLEPLTYSYFRRSRFAFAVAPLCQGARRADGLLRAPRCGAAQARCAAFAFSNTMRRYSAGEHVPSAIISMRRAIVSHEAKASSASMKGGKSAYVAVFVPLTADGAGAGRFKGRRANASGGRGRAMRAGAARRLLFLDCRPDFGLQLL